MYVGGCKFYELLFAEELIEIMCVACSGRLNWIVRLTLMNLTNKRYSDMRIIKKEVVEEVYVAINHTDLRWSRELWSVESISKSQEYY